MFKTGMNGGVGVFLMNGYRLVEVLSGGVWAGTVRRDEVCDQLRWVPRMTEGGSTGTAWLLTSTRMA